MKKQWKQMVIPVSLLGFCLLTGCNNQSTGEPQTSIPESAVETDKTAKYPYASQ